MVIERPIKQNGIHVDYRNQSAALDSVISDLAEKSRLYLDLNSPADTTLA